jgi:hypothetical protein
MGSNIKLLLEHKKGYLADWMAERICSKWV